MPTKDTTNAPTGASHHEWAKLCSQQLRRAQALGERYEHQGWTLGSAYHTGFEWVLPACCPSDIKMACASGCGVVSHRWRPYHEAGPTWRCSECGGVTDFGEAQP